MKRKKAPADRHLTKAILLRLEPTQRARVEYWAELRGLTLTEWLRQAVDAYLGSQHD